MRSIRRRFVFGLGALFCLATIAGASTAEERRGADQSDSTDTATSFASRAELPTVATRGPAVTLTWRAVTRVPGVHIRLYGGDENQFRLLTEVTPAVGTETHSYVDLAGESAAVVYQLRWALDDGSETIIGTVLRVGQSAAPLSEPAVRMWRIDTATAEAQLWAPAVVSSPLSLERLVSAALFMPNPEVPPPRVDRSTCPVIA